MPKPTKKPRPVTRSVYFAEDGLWTRLDEEASHHFRSPLKHLEAILVTYFKMRDLSWPNKRMDDLLAAIPPGGQKLKPAGRAIEAEPHIEEAQPAKGGKNGPR